MRSKKKRPFVLRLLVIVFTALIAIAAVWTALSFAGRKAPGDVIPEDYTLFFHAPNPGKLAGGLVSHEPLREILLLPEFASALPLYNKARESGLINNGLLMFALRGRLEGALYEDGSFLLAWDTGLLSPLLRALPAIAGNMTIPGLYYVNAGRYSRFEYRMPDGKTFFIGPYHNLLVVSSDSGLFESVLDGKITGAAPHFSDGGFDAACIFRQKLLEELAGSGEHAVSAFLESLQFDGPVQASVTIHPGQLDIELLTAFSSREEAFQRLIGRASDAPDMYRVVPGNTQYLTLLAAGPLEDLLNGASAVPGSPVREPWQKADSSSRSLLGMGVEELLFSWSGEEFAAFGMEGRPAPVIVIEIKDEKKRQEVFSRAFDSFIINENINLNLDGNRIPRVELPAFLSNLLLGMGVVIPSPYYTVYNGYLFVSESPESLLDAVNGARRNQGLLRTELWQNLAKRGEEASALTLFYTLDRSAPFFLTGDTPAAPVLRLYRQGLLRLAMKNNEARLTLSVISGQGRGLAAVQGFPMDAGGRIGNQAYFLGPDTSGESRILLTSGNTALSINPADASHSTLPVPGTPGRLWVIPAHGIDGAVWVVSPQGRVYLCDKNLTPLKGFPRITSLRLSAPPAAHNGKLYLSDFNGEEASLYTIDSAGFEEKLPITFGTALLSPLEFLTFGGRTYAACYPKEFLGSIWLLDGQCNTLPGWPQMASGIAFGSPLVFENGNRAAAAFVTQAGELSVYEENGQMLPGFPLALEGVFYIQPVFDGRHLWLAAEDGTLFKVSLDGVSLSHKIENLEVREEGCIVLFDTDRDTVPEVFISGEGNVLHGYSQNFSSLDNFPLPLWGKPAFSTSEGGNALIAGAGMDNRIYLWRFK